MTVNYTTPGPTIASPQVCRPLLRVGHWQMFRAGRSIVVTRDIDDPDSYQCYPDIDAAVDALVRQCRYESVENGMRGASRMIEQATSARGRHHAQ